MENTIQIFNQKAAFLPLLLLADPDEAMINRYLGRSDLFVSESDGVPICVSAVLPLDRTSCELKNLAVEERFQCQGIGSRMIRFLLSFYAARYKKMYVGTSEGNFSFYQKNGFRYSHVINNFFTENYPEPIVENGIILTDMTYFVRSL
ncbi:GNAT family N-acetyltransferase [Caproicibacter sp.]|uniref:GNAT family N-acetyltransferase n=1 Tax=Caproicibacter sp. TaxID=2814884 RepID=UPI003989F460